MSHFLRGTDSLLALLALTLGVFAQHPFPVRHPPETPPDGIYSCHCEAGGADCLFGTAAGCSIDCEGSACDCRGASCLFGFPRASRCHCNGIQA